MSDDVMGSGLKFLHFYGVFRSKFSCTCFSLLGSLYRPRSPLDFVSPGNRCRGSVDIPTPDIESKSRAADTPCMSSLETPQKDASSLQKASPSELKQLLRVGLKSTIHADSLALGLDPDLISGASGAEFHGVKEKSIVFGQLDAKERESWEEKAQEHNDESRRFWEQTLAPVPAHNTLKLFTLYVLSIAEAW
ncbi:hypothetical protein FB451DRAFT_1534552 [Mycena latifolia]|nr:hypothetical protein FB451DRAFT_1534552 [Mycena latifolia]